MRRVGDHREDVLQDVAEVRLVEALGSGLLLGHVLQQRVEDLQTGVGHIPHRVFEGPNDGVQHQFELSGRDGEECWETVGVYSLEQVEKVGPVLRILFKVLGGKTHTQRKKDFGLKRFTKFI